MVSCYKFTVFKCIIIYCTLIPSLSPHVIFVVMWRERDYICPCYPYKIIESTTLIAVLSSGCYSLYTIVGACYYCAA